MPKSKPMPDPARPSVGSIGPGPGGEDAPGTPAVVDDRAEERASRIERARERSGASTERVRKHRARKAAEADSARDAEDLEREGVECGAVFAVVYDLALVPIAAGRLGPLNGEQANRAGRALVPLVRKYAPMLGDWQAEIAATLILASIFRENWREPEKEIPLEEVEPIEG